METGNLSLVHCTRGASPPDQVKLTMDCAVFFLIDRPTYLHCVHASVSERTRVRALSVEPNWRRPFGLALVLRG